MVVTKMASAKLSAKKITDSLSNLKYNPEFFNPQEGNFGPLFYEDKKYFTYALIVEPNILQFASEEFKSDKEIVELAVSIRGSSFEYASDELKDDKEFVDKMAKIDKGILPYVSDDILLDKSFLSQFDGFYLSFILENGPDELKNDREFVLKVVSECGNHLRFLCDEFRNDYDVVLASVKDNGNAYEYASDNLKVNKDIVIAALTGTGNGVLEHAPSEITSNREYIKLNAYKDGNAIYYAADEFKADKELIKIAAGSKFNVSQAYRSISSNLLKDKEFMIELLQIDEEIYDYMDPEMQKDPDIKLLYKIKTL